MAYHLLGLKTLYFIGEMRVSIATVTSLLIKRSSPLTLKCDVYLPNHFDKSIPNTSLINPEEPRKNDSDYMSQYREFRA